MMVGATAPSVMTADLTRVESRVKITARLTSEIAWARRSPESWLGEGRDWPAVASIDTRLLAGGALFGLGWGLAGFCPGPALVALSSGMADAWIFVPAMLAGMVLHDRFMA